MFRLSKSTLENLNLAAAVGEEQARSAWGFPSRSIERAALGNEAAIAQHIEGLLQRGIEMAGAEIIQVPKSKGFRPLAELSFVERSVYRALTRPFQEQLSIPARSFERYDQFSNAPLESTPNYVVRADVASFYQYVDHDLLHEEIVSQTGRADDANSIASLLHGMQQRRVGLPQLYDPSDWLSEILIDRVERAMIQAGYVTYRFNDDFRIACSSWAEAMDSLLLLDKLLRSVGLITNDEKTFIQTTDSYNEWLQAPEAEWIEIAASLGLDIRTPDWESISTYARVISPLVGEEIEDGLDDAEADDEDSRMLWVEAAKQALVIWIENKHRGEIGRLRQAIDRRLLRQAVRVLTSARAPEGLDYCKPILLTEQHVTELVGKYLRAVAFEDLSGVTQRISDWIAGGIYLSDWQKMWLMEPLRLNDNLPKDLLVWIEAVAGHTESSVLRSRALSLLVKSHAISLQDAAREVELLTDSSALDLIFAITFAASGEGPIVDALKRRDFLSKLVVESTGL